MPLVAPVGFEPTTLSLEVSCSIQLSYGATCYIIITCLTQTGEYGLSWERIWVDKNLLDERKC